MSRSDAWIFESLHYYRIQPNYRTVRLGFSKMLGKLVVKQVPTYTKGTRKRTYQIMLMRCFLYVFFF